jgi:hypothetical protein
VYCSFTVSGIRETFESGHVGQAIRSFIFKTVALQKHDSHSAKCKPDESLGSKFSITGFACISLFYYSELIFVVKQQIVVAMILREI